MSTISDYYTRYWSKTGFAPTGHRADWKLRQLFERTVTPDDDALDVGCGDGSKSGSWLTAHARSYRGVDVSTSAVALARSRGFVADVIGDAGDLPFANSTFDVVVICEVLEHLFDPLGAACEARRVLRPGGHLVMTVPNIGHWRNRVDLAVFGRWHPGGDDRSVREPWRDPHIRFFTPRTMLVFLEAAGFDPLDVGGYVPYGGVLGRMPVARRLMRAGDEPGLWSRALVGALPSVLGTHLYALARPLPS